MGNERRVVVIGSGPAGASAARELVRRGVPVLMLESGSAFQPGLLLRLAGRTLIRQMPSLLGAESHAVSGDPRTQWYANIAPGGLSNLWSGAVPRFAPEDFTEGARLHERYRWPVAYEDLAPFYEAIERLLGITADTRDVLNLPAGHVAYPHRLPEDWRQVECQAQRRGQGFTTMPLADGPRTMLVRRGTAFNSYANFVLPMRRSRHFELRVGSHALRLNWSAAKRRVDAVIYHDRNTGETHSVEADAVVVACGALQSAKLLFNSACPDFPEGLGNARGVLGRFVHDHPREWWAFELDRPVALLSPAAYLTRLPYESSPPLLATSWTLGTAGVKDRIRSRFGAKGTWVGVQVFGTMIPTETRFVRSSAEHKDQFGLPGLELRIDFSEAEIENVVRSRQHLMDLMREAGYAPAMGEVMPQLVPGTSAHYGGTARMHADPEYGVVDAWNRIHDAPNVLVCDASCFTTAVEKNPTLTVMALASRAAARLSDDLKNG